MLGFQIRKRLTMGVSPKHIGLGGLLLMIGASAGWASHTALTNRTLSQVLNRQSLLESQMPAARSEKCKTRGFHAQLIRMKRSISGEG